MYLLLKLSVINHYFYIDKKKKKKRKARNGNIFRIDHLHKLSCEINLINCS